MAKKRRDRGDKKDVPRSGVSGTCTLPPDTFYTYVLGEPVAFMPWTKKPGAEKASTS